MYSLFVDPPTVQITSTIFPVLIGNQVILGCNVVANPAATDVYWIFTDLNNQQTTIRQNTNVAKYGGVTLQSPSLVLKSAEFSDEGKYTCYATNSIGTGNSLTADLDVTGSKLLSTFELLDHFHVSYFDSKIICFTRVISL